MIWPEQTLPAVLNDTDALHTQQDCASQIGALDNAITPQGKVAHRGKIIQVGELIECRFQLRPGLLQFLVLYLQLDLMHFQFMHKAQGIINGSAFLF